MPERAGSLSLGAALAALSDRRLLVASDFDGTLAPLINDPDLSKPAAGVEPALQRIAAIPGVTVAIVSGRRRAQLVAFFAVNSPYVFVGEHGNETGSEPGNGDAVVAAIGDRLRQASADLPGSWVEEKTYSAAIHYRMSPPESVAPIMSELGSWAAGLDGVTVMAGNMILELGPVARNKGDAIAALRQEHEVDQVVFFGDDVTDETVFTTLVAGDVGVKVGPGETAAGYRVPGIGGVVDALTALAEMKGGPG